jgi:hypothetical protein
MHHRASIIILFHGILNEPENIIPLAVLSQGYAAEEKEGVDRFNPTRLHTN